MKCLLSMILIVGFLTQAVSVKASPILTPEMRLKIAVDRTFSENVTKGIKAIAVLGAVGIGMYGFSHLCCALNLNIDDSLVLGLMLSNLIMLPVVCYDMYKEHKKEVSLSEQEAYFINNENK